MVVVLLCCVTVDADGHNPPPCRRTRRALLFRPSCGLWFVVLEGPHPCAGSRMLLLWLFHIRDDNGVVFMR